MNQAELEKRFTISAPFRYITIAMVVVGILAFVYGFIQNPKVTWAHMLLNNYYFLSLAIGASFFLALQYITQSGWSSMFKRVPEAMAGFTPVGGILMLIFLLGMHSIYHWTHHDVAEHDPLIAHKTPYLNPLFFIIRLVIYFAAWTIMTRLLRKYSVKEDIEGGTTFFKKSEFYSRIFIFIIAITFSFATFDWIMSIDAHWYSTIFSLRGFVQAFYHAAVIITLLVLFLNDKGFFPQLNESHLLDFSRYIFMLCIVWGYLFFAEFMLIWYGNIPEETMYFHARWQGDWKFLFYINPAINWLFPFVILMSQKLDKNKAILKFVCFVLIIGQWIDLYLQIIPGAVGGVPHLGFIEIGSFLGYAGLFILVFAYTFSKANSIPKNHPYLEESVYHHVH